MNTNVTKKTNTTNEITVVQNGNYVISPQVDTYVSRYQSFLKKTAESILGLAQTLLEAKTNLNGVDFNIFCHQVGTDEQSTTYNKLMKIANNAARFVPYTDRLPNTWTTIYKLASLSAEEFEQVSSNLTPFITAKEIDELAGKQREVRSPDLFDIKLCFEQMTPEQKLMVYDEIEKLKAQFNFKVNEHMSFKREMTAFKTEKKNTQEKKAA